MTVETLQVVAGGGSGNYSRQEILAALPKTLGGQLHGFIAQGQEPNKKLRDSIIRACRKHYLSTKYKRRWTKKAMDLFDDEIDDLTNLALTQICTGKAITVRYLATKRNEPQTTFFRNYYDVYLEIQNHINNSLIVARRRFNEKIQKN